MAAGRHPDWRSRAATVDHFAGTSWNWSRGGGGALARLLGTEWFHGPGFSRHLRAVRTQGQDPAGRRRGRQGADVGAAVAPSGRQSCAKVASRSQRLEREYEAQRLAYRRRCICVGGYIVRAKRRDRTVPVRGRDHVDVPVALRRRRKAPGRRRPNRSTLLPMPVRAPSAPVESRPPYVRESEEIRRWDLAVAVAPILLGEDASAADLWRLARQLYADPSLPTG
jgi:hypothetical protein